jgi:hypothetical protein
MIAEPGPELAEPEPVEFAPLPPEIAKVLEPRQVAVAGTPAVPYSDPEAEERISLAVAGQPLRYLDPDVEYALDELARAAREEILSVNAPAAKQQEEDATVDDYWPWLTNLRKAWEPPAAHPHDSAKSRWTRFRRD